MPINIKRVLFLSVLFFQLATLDALLFGQFVRDSAIADSTFRDPEMIEPDTLFFYTFDRFLNQTALDRMDTDSVVQYWNLQPAYKGNNLYFNLGNNGSANMSAFRNFNRKVGWEDGINQFNLYKINSDSLAFISSNKAYAQIAYNQAPVQTKSQTDIVFGRSYGKNAGISLQYNRINELGEYDAQRIRTTGIGLGLFYFPKPKWKFIFSVVTNNIIGQENGGIVNDSLFGNEIYDDRTVYPIKLGDAQYEEKDRETRLNIYHDLVQGADSTAKVLRLIFDSKYAIHRYKYFDDNPPSTTPFYNQYQTLDEGIRYHINHRTFSNKLAVQFGFSLSKNSAYEGKLTLGAEHQAHKIDNDLNSFNVNNLVISGRLNQQLSDYLSVSSFLETDLLDQAGNYNFAAKAKLNLSKNINFYGGIESNLHSPYQIQNKFQILDEVVFDNSFDNTLINSLNAGIVYTPLNLQVNLKNSTLTDYIYFDDDLLFHQLNSTENLLQLTAEIKKQVGIFYTENFIYLQTASNEQIIAPKLMTKHYFGLKLKLFEKKLNLDVGTELFVLPDFPSIAYFPVTGQFYNTPESIYYNYKVNGIMAIQIQNFQLFTRFENLSGVWDKKIRYLVKDYPQFDYNFRLGIRWLMRS